ncbi:hypothetical protein [Terrimonas pollutisoli]|uniref:hypothetical protein n=1 Tax=Terrimonas pollutisoli TaxID=3034147 RepID=UPI0023EBB983|nr:hypothetical protein [Terrimonas sp. H1YJ31]
MRLFVSMTLLLIFCLFNFTCKKESGTKYCWQIIDGVGNDMGIVCDKTEAELLECVNNHTCGIYLTTSLTNCFYYKAEGEEYCWFIDSSYMIKATETKMAHLRKCFNFTSTAVKVDCNYCQFWYSRKKSAYKPNGQFTYSPITRQQYCGDTTQTLYQGREIVLKNDADSLVVIQFSKDGVIW